MLPGFLSPFTLFAMFYGGFLLTKLYLDAFFPGEGQYVHWQCLQAIRFNKSGPPQTEMANVTDGSEPDIQRIPAADPPSTSPASSPPTPSAAAAAPLHSVRHEKLLQEWGTERKEEREIKELYRARCTSNKTEMYQLMGFFSVFQGVVFSTVATSTKLTCQTSLLPALLSFLVFIGTAISVHNKFNDYELDTQKLINSENTEEVRSRSLSRQAHFNVQV
jgi:hypothetical protein